MNGHRSQTPFRVAWRQWHPGRFPDSGRSGSAFPIASIRAISGTLEPANPLQWRDRGGVSPLFPFNPHCVGTWMMFESTVTRAAVGVKTKRLDKATGRMNR